MENSGENIENVTVIPCDKVNHEVVCSSPNKSNTHSSILKPHNCKTEDLTLKEFDKQSRKSKAIFSSKDKNKEELHGLYFEGIKYIQKLQAAFQKHKTQTFFRPDVIFMRGVGTCINQLESSINKMGQLFSSSSFSSVPNIVATNISVKEEEKCPIPATNISPPASETGNDVVASDTSTSTEQTIPSSSDSFLQQHSSSASSSNTSAAVKPSNEQKASTRRGTRKRKRLSLDIESTQIKVCDPKRPRRSLFNACVEVINEEDVTPVKEIVHEPPDTRTEKDDKEKDDKEEAEFEVEKIIDYDKVKGANLYLVRWRGYGPDDDTWEPLDNLTGCEEILLSFIRARMIERSAVTSSEKLKELPLPCEDKAKSMLRAAFFAQHKQPSPSEVISALPTLLSGRIKIKSPSELEEDVDKIVAVRDCLTERYKKLCADFKQQLVLKECKKQRELQSAELRRWEREMSKLCSDPAPLRVVNDVDLSLPPTDFIYINEYIAGKGINIPQDPFVGCECSDCSSSPNSCCAAQMSSFFAYNKYGRLKVSLGTAIYECNKACSCSKKGNCHNRVVQKGRTLQLTIFRTDNNRGWGVKAGELIRAGSFVTEYVGEVISSEEAERRGQYYDAKGCTYLFDLDYNKGDQNPYTVDAAKYGNVSHFINHSCDPNLVVYNVWVNCLDPDLPRLALFASRDIKKGEEVTFDYNSPSSVRGQNAPTPEDFDVVLSSSQKSENSLDQSLRRTPKRGIANGKTRCHCGAANCRKFFF